MTSKLTQSNEDKCLSITTNEDIPLNRGKGLTHNSVVLLLLILLMNHLKTFQVLCLLVQQLSVQQNCVSIVHDFGSQLLQHYNYYYWQYVSKLSLRVPIFISRSFISKDIIVKALLYDQYYFRKKY